MKDDENVKAIVYISSPYRGKNRLDQEQNVLNAKKYARFALENGYCPIAPHLAIAELTNDADETDRFLGIRSSLTLLRVCSEIWVFGSQVTEGMELEIKAANRLNLKIRWFTCTYEEYSEEIVNQKLYGIYWYNNDKEDDVK